MTKKQKKSEKNVTVGIRYCDCTACEACVEMCPELFEWDVYTKRILIKDVSAREEEVRNAIKFCPQGCIVVSDDLADIC